MSTIWGYLTFGVICLSGGIHIGMAINGSILKKEIDMLKNRLIRKECEIDELKNRLIRKECEEYDSKGIN